MILQNGYIQFKSALRALDEDGNPIVTDEDWGEMIPANVSGNVNYDGYKDEGGDRYKSPTYQVYVNAMDLTANRCRLYDRNKRYLGEFYIRTRQYMPLVKEIRLTL